MIYWRIRTPWKSWRDWSNGVASDVDEAKVESVASVLGEDHQLLPQFASGVNVEMYECEEIDHFVVDEAKAKEYRTNYLGLTEA